jgi:hypothetical protein
MEEDKKQRMTIRIEQTISDWRFDAGQELLQALNDLTREQKNAIIGFRWQMGNLPEEVDTLLESVDKQTALNAITKQGICRVSDEQFESALTEFRDRVGDLYEDGEAWSVLTVLEILESEMFGQPSLEAVIYENDDQINEIEIDLVNDGDDLELYTCKFKISSQHEDANRRLDDFQDYKEELTPDAVIGVGTLSLMKEERIRSDINECIEVLITGHDILDFS